jgi:tetratricopeptide (TPR) repeat protein
MGREVVQRWCCVGLFVGAACGGVARHPIAAPASPPVVVQEAAACEASARGPEAAHAQGVALVQPYLILADAAPVDRPTKKSDLRLGIVCFEDVLRAYPDNWRVMWLQGKAHQALGEYPAAVRRFEAAYRLERNDPNVGRELVAALLETGANGEAVTVATEVAVRHADDAGLVANLAVALLLDGQVDLARDTAERALALDPADTITVALREVIEEIAGGRRPRPRTLRELERR